MAFTNILFLTRFLPIFLIIYYLVPIRFRNGVLFVGSLFFYAWGEKWLVLILYAYNSKLFFRIYDIS